MKNELLCPKCNIKMDFIAEAENSSDGNKIVRYFYRCPACGTRLNDEIINIKKENDSMIIKISQQLF
ncbi:hypothetical protein EWF20_08960 [Sulfolobus sp. S-194]|uniref:hypothetical protein n=1 Tax=Sulfolobus sp. S-194 TaxID=2512240 RepID=UPI001436E036|nr:hypothetical protein [Sulfolobus sp. S-194]QIW24260.1 hypothetical protein EWF20_08960 [Sulfolobus sp. S-194]